jgi:two-component system, NarL family, response regulator DesR
VTTRDPNMLTKREAQIVQLLAQGLSTRDIAISYGIGHQTVKNYVTVIYEKLGLHGREQLLRFVQESTAPPTYGSPEP